MTKPAPQRHKMQPPDAPSVLSPEIVIPSAGACAPLSRVVVVHHGPCRLRVSGAVAPSASACTDSPVVDAYWYAAAYSYVKHACVVAASMVWSVRSFLKRKRAMTPYFFGYGSLVNTNTHTYPDARLAKLTGWRRAWVRTAGRDIVYLTVVQDAPSTIDGVIAAVPDADWVALDAREYGYARHNSGRAVTHSITPAPNIAHYAIPPEATGHAGDHVILLSYLDVVVQGFLNVYGQAGVARFFDTTDGWDTPVLNDRTEPMYPRHQVLTKDETGLVDYHLNRLSARVEQRHQTAFSAKNF